MPPCDVGCSPTRRQIPCRFAGRPTSRKKTSRESEERFPKKGGTPQGEEHSRKLANHALKDETPWGWCVTSRAGYYRWRRRMENRCPDPRHQCAKFDLALNIDITFPRRERRTFLAPQGFLLATASNGCQHNLS